MRNIKKSDVYIKIAAVSVFVMLLVFVSVDLYRFRLCFTAAKNLPVFSHASLMRFLIYGSGGDTISAVFRLYDSQNEELAAVERSWKGNTLTIDFTGASFGGKTVYFPRCISASASKRLPSGSCRTGTRLSRYYMCKDNCLLYNFPDYEKDFFRLARYALRLDIFGLSQRIAGSSYITHRVLSLAGCEPGKTYIIQTDSAGTLNIVEE